MKILIIRFSSIGDIVLTSPVIRCLFQQKKAEITFLTKAAFAAIPAANPMVSRVIALGEQPSIINDKIRYAASFEELTVLLQTGNFDYIID
jgi:ADP-heptose:LPS heptosyltransferase